jgi:hypothetical protein
MSQLMDVFHRAVIQCYNILEKSLLYLLSSLQKVHILVVSYLYNTYCFLA